MNHFKKILEKKEQEVERMIEKLEKRLQNAPGDALRVSKSHNIVQYYHKNIEKGDLQWKYLKKEDSSLAKKIAQRDYDQKLLVILKRSLKKIRELKKCYNPKILLSVYDALTDNRKKLVIPEIISDEEYVLQWQQEEYEGKEIREGLYYTEKEEQVRSKSEMILADRFTRNGIPYHYEYPVYLHGYGTVYPDFKVLNKRTRREYYWEHLGMMDDEEYVAHAMQKIETYAGNGILPEKNLILTHETSQRPLNVKTVQKLIDAFLI